MLRFSTKAMLICVTGLAIGFGAGMRINRTVEIPANVVESSSYQLDRESVFDIYVGNRCILDDVLVSGCRKNGVTSFKVAMQISFLEYLRIQLSDKGSLRFLNGDWKEDISDCL